MSALTYLPCLVAGLPCLVAGELLSLGGVGMGQGSKLKSGVQRACPIGCCCLVGFSTSFRYGYKEVLLFISGIFLLPLSPLEWWTVFAVGCVCDSACPSSFSSVCCCCGSCRLLRGVHSSEFAPLVSLVGRARMQGEQEMLGERRKEKGEKAA